MDEWNLQNWESLGKCPLGLVALTQYAILLQLLNCLTYMIQCVFVPNWVTTFTGCQTRTPRWSHAGSTGRNQNPGNAPSGPYMALKP